MFTIASGGKPLVAFFSFAFCFTLLCGMSSAQDVPLHANGLKFATMEDLLRSPHAPTFRAFIPEQVDLTRYFPLVGNQGDQGSCVAWAVGYAARAYYARAKENRDTASKANIPSPAYIYNSIVERPNNCDAGASVIPALLLLEKGGLSLSAYPYNDKICSRPSADYTARATDFRIHHYQVVFDQQWSSLTPDNIKHELSDGNPVILEMQDTNKFQALGPGETLTLSTTPRLCQQLPSCARNPGTIVGGHAITAVGYDERRQAFKIINSWGTGWGSGGYGWIGYDAFNEYVRTAYVMRFADPAPEPPRPEPPKPSPPEPPNPVPPPKPPGPSPIVLPQLDCSEIRVVNSGSMQKIVGFVGHDEDLEKIRAAAPGTDVDVKVRPFPQCEALITLEKPLARPISELPKVKIRQPASGTLTDGDDLVFEIETPPYPSYLHVAYFQADGTGYQRVVNLIQPGIGSYTTYPPRTKLVLGNDPGARKFKVSPPFGREMLIVLAGHSPIFPERRKDQETEREFLTALRHALLWKIDPAAPDRDVVAAYDTTVTQERKSP